MHRIEYENVYEKIGKEWFENEYLEILGFGNYKFVNGKKTFELNSEYNKWNDEYKKTISKYYSSFSWFSALNLDLKTILLAEYNDLVKIFKAVVCKNKNLPQSFKYNLKKFLDYYDSHSKVLHSFFNKYSDLLRLYSCPYCETSYTGYYEVSEGESKKTRDFYELDHFFPKAEYPFLALSLYNFIPCCHTCNCNIKNHNDFFMFYDLKLDNVTLLEKKLLKLSPASEEYSFENDIFIRYIPCLEENNKWNYAPLSQKNIEKYSVFFDCDSKTVDSMNNANKTIINSMLLQERYNSTAIKNQGLYFLDLKKKYPLSKLNQMSKMLTAGGYSVSPEEIENDIFHKNEKYKLLEKMRNDLLE